MPATDLTPSQRLAELILGESLKSFVRSRRDEVPQVSWRRIALDLMARTDGDIELAPETLRLWYPDPPKSDEATEATA